MPHTEADYIIMGNFKSVDYLAAALIRSKKGTVISMHYLTPTENVDSYYKTIIARARRCGYTLGNIENIKVKSVGPHYWHMRSKFAVLNC